MGCTNCFSGCVETVSDKCVKYTGNDITFLNIHTGDTLESVEQHITDYLSTVFSGVGIVPTIDPTVICDVVKQFFPCEECGVPTLVDILVAIIKAICALETEIEAQAGRIDTIEGEYNASCLPGDPVGTHAVVQTIINSLCIAIGDIATLQNLYATCITESNINTYIQNYISGTVDTHMYTKMVPYVVYPFYPTATLMSGAFDINGVGLGQWQKIYLCNGYNGLTPDLRGRSLIGTTDMGGGAFNPDVDPSAGNPTYNLGTLNGQNLVTLSPSQIPAHPHAATVNITDPKHETVIHFGYSDGYYTPSGGSGLQSVISIEGQGSIAAQHDVRTVTTEPVATGLSSSNVSVSVSPNTPAGSSHTNVHPVIGIYYIMYLP